VTALAELVAAGRSPGDAVLTAAQRGGPYAALLSATEQPEASR
jgi:glutamate--cysteine ligase